MRGVRRVIPIQHGPAFDEETARLFQRVYDLVEQRRHKSMTPDEVMTFVLNEYLRLNGFPP